MQIVPTDFQDQFVRGLVHRMNNILSLFHGYLGLLMDDRKLDPVAREGLSKIKSGAQAASELMDRTNSLVRPVSAIWREVNVCDLLRQLRPTFENNCAAKVKIHMDCVDDLPLIWADPSRVRIALIELVRNACEAAVSRVTISVRASEGRIQGELFGAAAEQPEHWLTVSIADDGRGIPIEDAERIYNPFFTTKRAQHAAGLGLAVAMGCAQQLSGSLVHQRRDRETVFDLTLPSRVAQAVGKPAVA